MTVTPYSPVRYTNDPAPDLLPRWVAMMVPAAELARTVAATEFVPAALRNKAPAIAAAILYGDEVGLGPMQSLARIAMVDGKPTLAAETMRGLVLAAGHDVWAEETSTERVTMAGRRAGQDTVTRVTWTMDDARRANLGGKPSWRAYPRAMLAARASAELCRLVFADVIGGLMATEELDDDVRPGDTPTPAALEAPATPAKGRKTRQRKTAGPALAVAVPTVEADTPAPVEVPPLPGEEDPAPAAPELMRDNQRRKLMVLFRERGVVDRAKRLEYVARIVGRPLESSAELTVDEASRVIDDLASWDPDPA